MSHAKRPGDVQWDGTLTPEEAFLAWFHDERDLTWMRHAACKGLDPNLFFPSTGEDPRQALAVCAGCPVKAPCAEYGLLEHIGIYGGLTGRDRVKVRHTHTIRKKIKVRRQHGTVTGFHQHEDAGEPACKGCRAAYRAQQNPEQRGPNDELHDPTICGRCRDDQHGLCRFCACECRKQLVEENDGDEPVSTVA